MHPGRYYQHAYTFDRTCRRRIVVRSSPPRARPNDVGQPEKKSPQSAYHGIVENALELVSHKLSREAESDACAEWYEVKDAKVRKVGR